MVVIQQRAAAETVAGAFGSVVAAHGGLTALRGEGEQISYAELAVLARQVAAVIRQHPAGDRAQVGLLLDRSILAVAALLGAVHAGRAYVSLDTADAEERLAAIVDDAQVGLILTDQRHVALAQRIGGGRATPVDVRAALAGSAGAEADLPAPDPDDPIALVYTSGSTGRPKGVIQTQRNYAFYSRTYGEQVGLQPGDRLSMLANLSSGAANNQLLGGLLNATTVCLYDVRRRGPNGLPEWMASERINVLHVVPSLFRFIADNAPPGGYTGIRSIELGGEPVYGTDVRRGRAAFGDGPTIVNRYSATECVGIARHVATALDAQTDGVLRAGVAPPGIEVLIVDQEGRPLPAGETGQIVLRSRYLSPGYWGRPELTAAAFSADPDEPGVRRYRSGDTGTFGADGELTVHGRVDQRVKLRGYSIEPAEIESALRGLPGIIDAVVVAQAGPADATVAGAADSRLVAHVVLDHAGEFDAVATRRALSDKLPLHMLPAEFRVLPELPRTSTGKIDRQSLAALPPPPMPVAARASSAGEAEPPATETEAAVAALFARILGVAVNGRHDDFFALGGTSMTLAQLQTEARRVLGAELDLAELVRSATVADVAALVLEGRSSRRLVVPLRREGAAAPLFLISGWHGQAAVTPGFIDAVPASHPVLSIRARGLVDDRPPHTSVEAMAAEYLEVIKATSPNDQLPILVGICAGGIIALEMASQARAARGVRMPVVMLDPPPPPQARSLTWRVRDLAAFYVGLKTPRFGPARYVFRRIARRLRIRAERVGAPDLDAATLHNDAAIRVALSIGVALRRHRPRAYDGPVRVIASNDRLNGPMWQADGWPALLTGTVSLVGAGDEHMSTLNPANPRFRAALRSSIESLTAE